MSPGEVIRIEAPSVNFHVSSAVSFSAARRCPISQSSLSSVERIVEVPVGRTLPVEGRPRLQITYLSVPPISSILDLRLTPPSLAYSEKRVIDTLIVTPTNATEATTFLESKFEQFTNNVSGILAYIDDTTFEFIKAIPGGTSIRLFTSATAGDAKKIAERLQKEHGTRDLEIIQLTFVGDSSERPLFHERWITDGKVMIDIGTDLKKATFTSKAHTISVYDAGAYRDRLEVFQKWWASDETSLSEYFGGRIRKRDLGTG